MRYGCPATDRVPRPTPICFATAKKEKVAETATFCPAYGHIGARRCRTDWGAWGVIRPTWNNAIGSGRFLGEFKIFSPFHATPLVLPNANAGGFAGVR